MPMRNFYDSLKWANQRIHINQNPYFQLMKAKPLWLILGFDESHKLLIDLILFRNYSYTFVTVLRGYINNYILL